MRRSVLPAVLILFALVVALTMAGAASASSVTFQAIDGGANYFANLSARSAWMDRHILVGAWMEQPQTSTEVGYATAMGDNMYWNLAGTPGQDRVDYNVMRAAGMHVSAPDTTANTGSETVAWDGSDEADMNFGPGSNGWQDNGTYDTNACVPSGAQCGYTATNFYYTGQPSSDGSPGYPIDGRAVHQGYGKGVLFWETDQQAARFMKYSDVLSADSYWITDNNLQVASQGGCALLANSPSACGGGGGAGLTSAQSQLPSNYAYDVTQMEHLAAVSGTSKPVVVDVETGCPFSNSACITPPQTIAAAWHSLIAGARGIIWFQHNFGGPCVDFRTLIDGSNPASGMYNCQQTPGVTLHNLVQDLSGFGHEVASLNNALLSPTAKGYVRTTGDVSTLAKVYGGACYVFAGSGQPVTPPAANQSVTFTLADSYTGAVTVYNENRSVQATNGVFTDKFADANAVHVYQVNGGATCGVTPTVPPGPTTPTSGGGSGAGASGGAGGSAGAGRRFHASVLSSLRISPARFRAAGRGPSIAVVRYAHFGTTITYWDSQAARTRFAVFRAVTGVRRSGRCVAPGRRRAEHAARCTRLVRMGGSFWHNDRAGWNRVRFTGRMSGRELAPGAYRLKATPRQGAGLAGRTLIGPFRILA